MVGGWWGGIEKHLTSCCKVTLRVSLFIQGEMKGGAENCIFSRAFLNFHLSRLSAALCWVGSGRRSQDGGGGRVRLEDLFL